MGQEIHPPPIASGPAPEPVEPPVHSLAVAALVLGTVAVGTGPLGCACLPVGLMSPVLAVLAVVFGLVARRRIARGEGSGAGMALAGILCGAGALVVYGTLWLAVGMDVW